MPVPAIRIRAANPAPLNTDGTHVLYWMTSFRRATSNFALQRAVEHCQALGRPLVALEALRADYPWASARFHAFVIQGMRDNAEAFGLAGATYVPFVERRAGEGRGLLEALAARAAVVVTDDYPAFFVPRMITAAASRLRVRLEAVDSSGLLPIRATERAYPTAFAFRAALQKQLREHLGEFPQRAPLAALADAGLPAPAAGIVPEEVVCRWPPVGAHVLTNPEPLVAGLPIDQRVGVVPETPGGQRAAGRMLRRFLDDRLSRYATERNQPEVEATSGLSPYLHFGHISVHEVFDAVMTREEWTSRRLSAKGGGQREGWWGASPEAEAFLDELITWRELGHNMCHHRPGDHDQYSSLPAWARATLDAHAADPRPHVYSREQFDAAGTHDPLWNAAQRQLVREGRIHNYLRMLWGKKILEWSPSPQDALATMIELNNRYALDGRDPNSYSGIFWVLGRYDRPWAPERPVFGTIRYMSSENTARKARVKEYLRRYAASALPL
jgi:deoxyribodipyrimidine photo-lyase